MEGSARMDELPPMPTRLEINPDHGVMRGLFQIRNQDPALAKMVAEQASCKNSFFYFEKKKDFFPFYFSMLLTKIKIFFYLSFILGL